MVNVTSSKMAEFDDEDASKKMFGPLSFEETNLETYNPILEHECLLCPQKYSLKTQLDVFLKHIFEAHNLIIEDFQNIDRFDKYLTFWKSKFEGSKIENIIPSVKIEGTSQQYFMLSALTKEDKLIRHKLKLESALEEQQRERDSNNFKRACLFCKLEFEGKCYDYIKHLSTQHNLQLGKAENLVFITEFLNIIEQNITNLKCIYCEKLFTDRNVLKEHMRKKLHKRINPANRSYDKFYIINYLESDRNWQHIQKDDDSFPVNLDPNSDQEWSDWEENEQEIVCLFCDFKDFSFDKICNHMSEGHSFDFKNIVKHFDFYQKVKFVNFVRRQIHICHCMQCNKSFGTKNDLKDHMAFEKHFEIPDLKIFDQPEFYFPTYENDTFLYYLEEINENDILE